MTKNEMFESEKRRTTKDSLERIAIALEGIDRSLKVIAKSKDSEPGSGSPVSGIFKDYVPVCRHPSNN